MSADGTEQLQVEIDYEKNLVVIDGIGVQVQGPEGEPLDIDHASAINNYITFLESGENNVKPGGEEATIALVDPEAIQP